MTHRRRKQGERRVVRRVTKRSAPSDVVQRIARVRAPARPDDDDVLHARGLRGVDLVALPDPVNPAPQTTHTPQTID